MVDHVLRHVALPIGTLDRCSNPKESERSCTHVTLQELLVKVPFVSPAKALAEGVVLWRGPKNGLSEVVL